MLSSEIQKFMEQLRADGHALQGNGFGYVGKLKSTYKKTCKQIEELVAMIDNAPAEEVVEPLEDLNPNCMGQGADNSPTCTCRLVFENLNRS